MKNTRLLLPAACALPLALGLAAPASADVHVVASIKPLHSLVAAVMEGVGEPDLIVQGAGSPHTYSMKPSQAAALQDADVVFWIGGSLEQFLEKPISTIGANAMSAPLSEAPGVKTLGFRQGGTFEADDDGDQEGPFDPHVWLDPENAKAMADDIAATLAKADPDHETQYRQNAEALKTRIGTLETDISAKLAGVRGKPFIVFHDAYHYFENRFGVTAAGSIVLEPDVAPGVERLTEIRDKVRELGSTCVFAEPEFEPKLISVAIEGTKARSGVLDPLGADLAPGPDLYFTLLEKLADSLSSCLTDAK